MMFVCEAVRLCNLDVGARVESTKLSSSLQSTFRRIDDVQQISQVAWEIQKFEIEWGKFFQKGGPDRPSISVPWVSS